VILQGAFDPKGVAYAKLAQFWYLFPLYPLLAPYAIFVSWTVPDELAVKECVGNLRNTPALFVHVSERFWLARLPLPPAVCQKSVLL